jgi:hypothetical protein
MPFLIAPEDGFAVRYRWSMAMKEVKQSISAGVRAYVPAHGVFLPSFLAPPEQTGELR